MEADALRTPLLSSTCRVMEVVWPIEVTGAGKSRTGVADRASIRPSGTSPAIAMTRTMTFRTLHCIAGTTRKRGLATRVIWTARENSVQWSFLYNLAGMPLIRWSRWLYKTRTLIDTYISIDQ